jgi:hypothetical protein
VYGQEFRGIIEAPVGYTFVEADKKSFHVATMGYCASDKDYIRFSQTDPHSVLGSYIDPSIIGQSISMKWSDEDILRAAGEFKKRCKEIKAKDPLHNINVRQEMAKPTVLGNQLGLGAVKLQRQNRRFIKTVKEAERLQELISGLFPKVEAFKAAIREKGHIQRYLINEFGFIDYFFDVFSFQFNKKSNQWAKKHGDDSERVVAFPVQSNAFGMIQTEWLELERQGVNEEHNGINSIHDSLIFMPEISKLDRCIEQVAKVMNAPCEYLINGATGPEGLKVMVEFSVGQNWKEMREIKI